MRFLLQSIYFIRRHLRRHRLATVVGLSSSWNEYNRMKCQFTRMKTKWNANFYQKALIQASIWVRFFVTRDNKRRNTKNIYYEKSFTSNAMIDQTTFVAFSLPWLPLEYFFDCFWILNKGNNRGGINWLSQTY